ITPCMSGEEALRRFEKNEKFDLLSLDLNLGGKGRVHGPEVLQKASETQACRGVILISAIGDEGLRTVIRDRAGLQDLLQRPEELLESHGFKGNRGIAYAKTPLEKLAPEETEELRHETRD